MAEIQTSPCVVDSDVTLVNTTPSPVGPSDAIKSEPMDDSPRKRRSHALAREYLSQAAVNWQCAAEEEDAEDSILYEHASKRRRVTDVFKGHKKGYMRKGNKGHFVGYHTWHPGQMPVYARYYGNGSLYCRVYHEDVTPELIELERQFFFDRGVTKVFDIRYDTAIFGNDAATMHTWKPQRIKAAIRRYLESQGVMQPEKEKRMPVKAEGRVVEAVADIQSLAPTIPPSVTKLKIAPAAMPEGWKDMHIGHHKEHSELPVFAFFHPHDLLGYCVRFRATRGDIDRLKLSKEFKSYAKGFSGCVEFEDISFVPSLQALDQAALRATVMKQMLEHCANDTRGGGTSVDLRMSETRDHLRLSDDEDNVDSSSIWSAANDAHNDAAPLSAITDDGVIGEAADNVLQSLRDEIASLKEKVQKQDRAFANGIAKEQQSKRQNLESIQSKDAYIEQLLKNLDKQTAQIKDLEKATAADDTVQQKLVYYQTQLVTEKAKNERAVSRLRFELNQAQGLASKQKSEFDAIIKDLSTQLSQAQGSKHGEGSSNCSVLSSLAHEKSSLRVRLSKADERIKELAEERERSQETRRSIENQIQSTQVAVTKAKEATDREILEKEKAMLNLKKTHAKLRQELSQSAQIKLAADKLATELETSQAQAKKELESQSQEMEALRRRIAELEQAQTGATHTLASTKPSSIIVDQATFDLVTVGANAGKYLERDVRIVTTGDQRQWVERLVLQPLSLHCEGSTPDSESQTTIIDTPFRIIRQGDHRGKFVQQLEEAGNLLVRDGNTYVAWKMRNEVVMSL